MLSDPNPACSEGIPLTGTELTQKADIYAVADYFLRATGRNTIIDVGCENGSGLRSVKAAGHIGIDFSSNISWCRAQSGTWGEWYDADLSHEACATFSNLADEHAVVVCADLVQRLADPQSLIRLLVACYSRGAIVITSTPDRIRVRGGDHNGPPPTPSHIREWALSEYVAFLDKCGLPSIYAGYTLNNNIDPQAKAIITIHDFAVDRARVAVERDHRPIAILAAYNEADVITEVTEDLLAQGCDVVALDNWSTDGTWDAMRVVAGQHPSHVRVERFPSAGATAHYEWQALLRQKENIAAEFPGRWIIHTDADELRRSPFPELTLAEALRVVQQTGANRVSFNLINFRPVDDRPYRPGSLKTHFTFFEYGTRPGHFRQGKAWLQGPERVDLASSGGHWVTFPGACDFPYRFLLQHYPIRSQEHGRRKVVFERHARWSPHERGVLGWHVQYDGYAEDSIYTWDRDRLHQFDTLFWREHGLRILTDIEQQRLAKAPETHL
jgi:hypothetical protein